MRRRSGPTKLAQKPPISPSNKSVLKEKDRPAPLKASVEEVVAAIESLYADGVRPFGRILIKRLAERSSKQAGDLPRINTVHLRTVCEESDLVHVVPEEGSEYSALLVGRIEAFVDASSNEDPFPEGFWVEASMFFSGPGCHQLDLPSGRYACAQKLISVDIPFLAGCSLGQVCHFVQLAISKRHLLGFRDDHVVPYNCSAAVVKKRCAALQQPALELKKDTMPTATLMQARQCLQAMLASPPGSLPLSNVKRLFRSRHGLELSETALGHSRICDLLQDERFQDICSLRVQGSTYMVEPRSVEEAATTTAAIEDTRFGAEATKPTVARTFIHFELPPPPLARRAQSVPKDHGSRRSTDNTDLNISSPVQVAAEAGSVHKTLQIAGDASGSRTLFCPDEPLCFDEMAAGDVMALAQPTPSPFTGETGLLQLEHSCFGWPVGCPLATPSPKYLPRVPTGQNQVPTEEGTFSCSSSESRDTIDLFESLGLVHESSPSTIGDMQAASDMELRSNTSDSSMDPVEQVDVVRQIAFFCPDDPLCLEDADFRSDAYGATPLATPSPRYTRSERSMSEQSMSMSTESGEAFALSSTGTINLFDSLGLAQKDTTTEVAAHAEPSSERSLSVEPLNIHLLCAETEAESVACALATPSPVCCAFDWSQPPAKFPQPSTSHTMPSNFSSVLPAGYVVFPFFAGA